MTPLRSALSNWHLGGQNTIHRTFAAQVDVFVEQGRHNLGRGPIHESLRTQRVEDLVSFLLAQGTGWGRAGLLMPGRWPPTTIERGSGDPERIARGLYPYVRGQRLGRLPSSSRPRGSIPAALQLFPGRRWASLRVPSLGECSRFPACALSPPADSVRSAFDLVSSTALSATHSAPPCAMSSGATSTSPPVAGVALPLPALHRASSTTRSLYDGLNRRRVGLSTTSASGAAAALRLPSQVSGAIPASILSRCLSISVSLPSPYSNSFRVSPKLAEREPPPRWTRRRSTYGGFQRSL